MKNAKLKAIIVISALLLLLFTIFNMYISYVSIKGSTVRSIASQTLETAKSIADTMPVVIYEEFLENPEKGPEYEAIKRYLEDVRKKTGSLHVYTLLIDNPEVSRAMIAGLPPGVEALPIGGICTVPEEQVKQAYNGKPFSTGIIHDPEYGDYLTAGAPLKNSEGAIIGFLAIDISAEMIGSISSKVLKGSLSNLAFNGVFVLFLLVSFIFIQRWYQRELKKEVGETEYTYQSEFDSLLSSVRSLRHDYSNHIQVLHGLLKIESYDQALAYLTALSKEVHSIESIKLDTVNPGLGVLLETKRLLAQNYGIEARFSVSKDSFNLIKTTDLIKILSNLIDNAIEASLELPEEERKLSVTCTAGEGDYIFTVTNTGPRINSWDKEKIFESGFSTKKPEKGRTRGQGLFIVKEITSRYGGQVALDSHNSITSAKVVIPAAAGKNPAK
jgi:two-component system, LytTR family, sensor histidine kinase AgrC